MEEMQNESYKEFALRYPHSSQEQVRKLHKLVCEGVADEDTEAQLEKVARVLSLMNTLRTVFPLDFGNPQALEEVRDLTLTSLRHRHSNGVLSTRFWCSDSGCRVCSLRCPRTMFWHL